MEEDKSFFEWFDYMTTKHGNSTYKIGQRSLSYKIGQVSPNYFSWESSLRNAMKVEMDEGRGEVPVSYVKHRIAELLEDDDLSEQLRTNEELETTENVFLFLQEKFGNQKFTEDIAIEHHSKSGKIQMPFTEENAEEQCHNILQHIQAITAVKMMITHYKQNVRLLGNHVMEEESNFKNMYPSEKYLKELTMYLPENSLGKICVEFPGNNLTNVDKFEILRSEYFKMSYDVFPIKRSCYSNWLLVRKFFMDEDRNDPKIMFQFLQTKFPKTIFTQTALIGLHLMYGKIQTPFSDENSARETARISGHLRAISTMKYLLRQVGSGSGYPCSTYTTLLIQCLPDSLMAKVFKSVRLIVTQMETLEKIEHEFMMLKAEAERVSKIFGLDISNVDDAELLNPKKIIFDHTLKILSDSLQTFYNIEARAKEDKETKAKLKKEQHKRKKEKRFEEQQQIQCLPLNIREEIQFLSDTFINYEFTDSDALFSKDLLEIIHKDEPNFCITRILELLYEKSARPVKRKLALLNETLVTVTPIKKASPEKKVEDDEISIVKQVARLPPLPRSEVAPGSPPKPNLKLTQTPARLEVYWTYQGGYSHTLISSYELFAFQDTFKHSAPAAWKKVGEIKSIPLPIRCTLSHFKSGSTYYFVVRAKDLKGGCGNFSDVQKISLK